MSTYTGTVPTTSQGPPFGGQRYARCGAWLIASGSTTTYYYKQTNGTRGTCTSTGAIPAGAVVLYVVTA